MTTRAFSLLEMMFALALSGLVAAAATSATVSIYRSIVAMEHQTYAQEEAKSIIDTLSTSTLQVGGGAVRPWQAISNGCYRDSAGAVTAVGGASCGGGLTGGQRIDFLDLNQGGGQCRVDVTSTAATGKATACCINATNGFVNAVPLNVVLLPLYPQTGPQAGGGWRVFRCTPNFSTCSCALSPIPGGVDAPSVHTAGFAFPANYDGGILIP